MNLLIAEESIVGTCEEIDESRLPSGFKILEFPEETPIENLYYSEGKIFKKPEKPSEDHFWSNTHWGLLRNRNLVSSMIGSDWDGLLGDLRGSDIWRRSFEAASTSIAANAAWTLLQSTLVSTRHPDDFKFAIEALRQAMRASTGDFTKSQVVDLNEILSKRNFDLEIPESAANDDR